MYADPLKQKLWHQRNYEKIREYIDKLKDVPCLDCGQIFPNCVMEFDHVPERGKKLFNIGHFYGKIEAARFQDEIAKCDVVCANCHRIRTCKYGQQHTAKHTPT